MEFKRQIVDTITLLLTFTLLLDSQAMHLNLQLSQELQKTTEIYTLMP